MVYIAMKIAYRINALLKLDVIRYIYGKQLQLGKRMTFRKEFSLACIGEAVRKPQKRCEYKTMLHVIRIFSQENQIVKNYIKVKTDTSTLCFPAASRTMLKPIALFVCSMLLWKVWIWIFLALSGVSQILKGTPVIIRVTCCVYIFMTISSPFFQTART